MMTASLTDLQFAVMDNIAHDLFNPTNGADPESASDVHCYLWAEERARDLGLSAQQVGGLLTGLDTAGLLWMQKPSKGDPDGGCGFTEAGFEAWKTRHTA